MDLSPQAQQQVNELISAIEGRTGVRILAAAVAKADRYPELPWKAFTFGAAAAALASAAGEWLRAAPVPWIVAAVMLVAGLALTLAAMLAPPVARFFLSPARRDRAARQYAQTVFLTKELFNTPQRAGILVLVTLFERQVILMPDVGVQSRLDQAELQRIVAAMTGPLRRGEVGSSLRTGLAILEEVLLAHGFDTTGAPQPAPAVSRAGA